jgi:Tol biopolymer transport system component
MSVLKVRSFAGRASRVGAGLSVLVLTLGGIATTASADQNRPRATAQVVALDTGRLAFVRSNQIYTSEPNGTNVTKLTAVGKNYRPKWSPDGSRIAYVHETASGLRDIWVMSSSGSAKQQLTHLGDTTEPTWSPRGRWLAFGAAGTPPYSTFLSTPLQKIRSTAPFGNPIAFPTSDFDVHVTGTLDWSPGGKQIAYYSDTYPDSPDHYLLSYHTDTLAVDELDAVGGSCCGQGYFGGPAWSPDARYLAYTQLVFDLGQPAPAGPHIAVLAVGATTTPSRFPRVVGDSQPAFSPSGRQLAFVHKTTIDVANVDGSGRHIVTTGSQPDWQPVS